MFKITQIVDDRIKVWTHAWLSVLKPSYPNTLHIKTSASLHCSVLQDSYWFCCMTLLYYKRGAGQTQKQSPSLGHWITHPQRKRQMVIFFLFFSVSKPIPVKQAPAVPWLITLSDVQILLGSWASMPSLFAISAAHSMLVRGFPFIFTNASLAFWRLFSWKPRVQAPDSQRLAALLNALFISLSLSLSFSRCFFQRKDILVQLKKLQAENALRVWAVSPWCCSYPEHYYPLNHLSLSGQWSVLIFLGEATKQLW